MVRIVNKYGELLNSSYSLSVFNHLQYGWTSKCAQKFIKYPDFVLPDPKNNLTFGFKSFNDFFTRYVAHQFEMKEKHNYFNFLEKFTILIKPDLYLKTTPMHWLLRVILIGIGVK